MGKDDIIKIFVLLISSGPNDSQPGSDVSDDSSPGQGKKSHSNKYVCRKLVMMNIKL